jgi:hypothetical protein
MKNYRKAKCCGNCKYKLQTKGGLYVCNLFGNYFEEDSEGWLEFHQVYDINICDDYIPKNIIINKS